jgi:hypothetical protein
MGNILFIRFLIYCTNEWREKERAHPKPLKNKKISTPIYPLLNKVNTPNWGIAQYAWYNTTEIMAIPIKK